MHATTEAFLELFIGHPDQSPLGIITPKDAVSLAVEEASRFPNGTLAPYGSVRPRSRSRPSTLRPPR